MKKTLKLTPETKVKEIQDLLNFIELQYGDDTSSLEIFSDLSLNLNVHGDGSSFCSPHDPNFTLEVPENTEFHVDVEDM